MGKRQKSALETREKLLEVGKKLIEEKGFDSVSVEDITKACGVAKGTFYTYFKRKEDVIPEMTREPFHQLCEDICQMKDIDIYKKMNIYMMRFMKCVERDGIQMCRQWTCQVIDPKAVPQNRDGDKLAYDISELENLLVSFVESGELSKSTPVEKLARLLVSQLYGMMLCWCMSDGTFEPGEWVEFFCELEIAGIFKPYIITK
ncbi:MAG: TetR/AcrR family transcriptional regulator [Lachnospiraceae bacterium]|nr:TetR/AcrR family transcriptional regulator [Lachnospiraceae bacterium]